MELILSLLSDTVFILLWAVTAAVWVRVIRGYISSRDDAAPVKALNIITEPFLYPARRLLQKIGLGDGVIDLSPALVSFAVAAITAFLPISY